jgi:hypothetical protein
LNKGFKLSTPSGILIQFHYYIKDAPITCSAFDALVPFKREFKHARVSGQEIWIDDAPMLAIIQENASVFTFPGEVVYGPSKPSRTKTANCLGIYYVEGKGLDTANIFACVVESDKNKLIQIGEQIWKEGMMNLYFESLHA